MAINPPNFGIINAQAGQIVLDARNALQRILFFNDYVQNLGHDGLVTLGFSSDDANLMLAVYGNLAAVANMCLGAAYTGPSLPFNFLAQTIPLWAGG
jgi:hypothetical protein